MNTQEALEQAMLSRKTVSFEYNRLGRTEKEKVGNAHIILITNQCGRKMVTIDARQNNTISTGFKNFDLNNISRVEIIN